MDRNAIVGFIELRTTKLFIREKNVNVILVVVLRVRDFRPTLIFEPIELIL